MCCGLRGFPPKQLWHELISRLVSPLVFEDAVSPSVQKTAAADVLG